MPGALLSGFLRKFVLHNESKMDMLLSFVGANAESKQKELRLPWPLGEVSSGRQPFLQKPEQVKPSGGPT